MITILINTYGYVRVSSREQNGDRQLIALRELSIAEKNIFTDKQSGKDFDRPQYKKLVKKLKPDDLLYVKSIDRLGRNYEEILEQWRILTKEKRIDIVVLDMPLLDTRRGKDAAAKARGVKFGRPSKALPDNFEQIHRKWRRGQLKLQEAADACAMPVSTFYAKAMQFEKNSKI